MAPNFAPSQGAASDVKVTSQGDSLEAALNEPVREALEPYFEDQPFPDHTDTPIIAPVDVPP
jgi:hypothetical protein